MDEKKSIILLTGKPGSGKDTLANHLSSTFSIPHLKLSEPLIEIIKTMFNVDDEYIELLNEDRKLKEQPNDVFLGKSYRELAIWLAEECIKPKFGKDFFINHIMKRIESKRFRKMFIISDLGFTKDELSHIDTNKYNIYIVKITRDNIQEVKDSRENISENIYYTINNNKDIEHLKSEGSKLINKIAYENISKPGKTK